MKVLIVGAGIIGLTFAYNWLERFPTDEVEIIDKEEVECFHASGRNSGILHAGFYYNEDSLKGQLTALGNRQMTQFCLQNDLPILKTGKLVVAQSEGEIEILKELERRSKLNGAGAYIISQKEAEKIEPLVRTYKYALWSPNTASVNPKMICQKLRTLLEQKKVKFRFKTAFKEMANRLSNYNLLVNCAGLYADQIAHQFGIGKKYQLLPFKGLYLKYQGEERLKTQIYPVPNIKNPFLGVHFTLLADGTIKIGPTAIPALWRENYSLWKRFNWKEMVEITSLELKLFLKNSFGFRDLALYEFQYYLPGRLVASARRLVKRLEGKFTSYPPGIRAQLVDLEEKRLLMDFLVEYRPNQIHILNTISPAFTASWSFTDYIIETYLKKFGR